MGKKVLITDDAAFMRMLIKRMLETEGYETEEACDGVELLKKYEVYHPDMVTLDITMPNMDGLEALKRLKEKHPDATVVMCSAMGQKCLVLDAMKLGASDFIVKPFEKEKILEILKKHLK